MIPLNAPFESGRPSHRVPAPDIFEPPMLAHTYNPSSPPHFPLILQPKYDGVRMVWNGHRAFSRSGKPLPGVPLCVLDELETHFAGIPLDGELYAHRMGFEKIVSLARRASSRHARMLTYVVFDTPLPGDTSDRLTLLDQMLREEDPLERSALLCDRFTWVCGVPWELVRNADDVEIALASYVSEGYEGVMLRHPKAAYEHCRSYGLLKYKRFKTIEGVVVGRTEGEGKHKGRLGALTVAHLGGGAEVDVGTGFTDAEREAWWNRADWYGVRIVIKYQELSRYGVPRFPIFVKEL